MAPEAVSDCAVAARVDRLAAVAAPDVLTPLLPTTTVVADNVPLAVTCCTLTAPAVEMLPAVSAPDDVMPELPPTMETADRVPAAVR